MHWAVVLAAGLLLAGCAAPMGGSPPAGGRLTLDPPPPGVLRVHYVDVGQGDGTIWQMPDGTVIVYDCGDRAESPAANPMNRFLREEMGLLPGGRIHALIASHGHLDHIGGCEEILEDYYVEHLYDTWYDGMDAPESYKIFREQVRSEGGTIHVLRSEKEVAGEVPFKQWDLVPVSAEGRDTGASARIIWPYAEEDNWDSIAEESIGVRLVFGSTAFCFQGDIEMAQETALAESPADLDCEVYLMGHHGSRYASGASWLSKMDPEFTVVSFGENSYGHPTSDALCRVQAAGSNVYATHRLGDITVSSDGTNITVEPPELETGDYCAPGADYWSGASPGQPIPPSAPSSPMSSAATPSSLLVTASVNNPEPCRYTEVTVSVHAQDDQGYPVSGASVSSSWKYKSTTSSEPGTTNSNGDASLTRSIGGATAGYTVQVTVTVTRGSASASASTSFTPKDC